MSLKYGALCLVLLLMVFFLATKSYDALIHPLELIPDKGVVKKSGSKTEGLPVMAVAKEPAPIASYSSIAEKNIFNPERKDFKVTGPGSVMKPTGRPQVVLYGVTIAENYQSASVVNPGRPLKKGEREQMTLKLGERIGEYKLAKVSSDRITLEAQGDTFEVLLYDPRTPKKRTEVRTESKPATPTQEAVPPGVPPSPSTPMVPSRPPARREGTEGAKESGREKPSPSQTPEPAVPSVPPSTPPGSTPTPSPGSAPTPTPLPSTMTPTIITPPMTPTPLTPPPGMGQPVPLPSGGPTQPPSGGGQ
jgi:hypothetical protein